MAEKLRYALVGVGANVYNMHEKGLGMDGTQVAAVCDLRIDPAQTVAEQWECPYFLDYHQMVDEIKPDVVVVMVPHTLHKDFAVYALRAGAHVLCEKPMGLEVAEADEMIAVAAETGKTLAINFQHRLRPEVIAARKIIEDGQLGNIQHVDFKVALTRTYKYYAEAGWRGSWNGEGGAVLMNQAPHEIDLVCYLAGMPTEVYAWTPTIAHQITPEDTVQAMMKWGNGAMGSFHASTAEAGPRSRFEIIGTGGYLQIQPGSLKFFRFETDVIEFLKTSDEAFAAPKAIEQEVELGDTKGTHVDVHRNFRDALLNNTAPVAPAASGIIGLELANGMNYSNYGGQSVKFPLDRVKYSALLADLQAKEAAQMA